MGRVRESAASVLGSWVGAGLFQLIAPAPRSQDRGFRSFPDRQPCPKTWQCCLPAINARFLIPQPPPAWFSWLKIDRGAAQGATGPPPLSMLLRILCVRAFHLSILLTAPRMVLPKILVLGGNDGPSRGAAPRPRGILSSRILGRRTARIPPFLIPNRAPHGFTQDPSTRWE